MLLGKISFPCNLFFGESSGECYRFPWNLQMDVITPLSQAVWAIIEHALNSPFITI